MGEKVQQLFELFQSYRTVQPGHKMAPALGEREREREICFCPGQRSCSLYQKTDHSDPTDLQERERDERVSE